jgi:hypothetical protein
MRSILFNVEGKSREIWGGYWVGNRRKNVEIIKTLTVRQPADAVRFRWEDTWQCRVVKKVSPFKKVKPLNADAGRKFWRRQISNNQKFILSNSKLVRREKYFI